MRFRDDDAVECPPVFQQNDSHAEIGVHDRARVDDVFQQEIEVISAGAGEVESGVVAVAVKDVAGCTGFVEDRAAIDRALSKLAAEFRTVLVLRLVNGYSTGETAAILGVPTGTVLSRLARAQKKMRELLTPYFGEAR